VLIAEHAAPEPDDATALGWCAASHCPVLVVHGDDDHVVAARHGRALAAATGGRLVVLGGAGHIPNARDPVRVNRLIREFAESLPAGGVA
jgi:pimeloyl-ACP methyl ester carboxylesterase